jgi:hypothetical protein
MNAQLEQALYYSGQAKDIESLKALARQESNRADRMAQMLVAVLKASGPVVIDDGSTSSSRNAGGFTLTEVEGRKWRVEAT